MKWFEDWEHPNDHIYAIERQKDIEAAWQQWEEEQVNKKRKPAKIKIVNLTKDETKHQSSEIRGTYQKRVQS